MAEGEKEQAADSSRQPAEEPAAEEQAPEAEEAPAQEAPEEEPAAEEPAAEEPDEETPAQEAPEEEPAAEEPSEEAPAAEPEALGPKARRRLERSRATGPPGPARTPEQRAAERAERQRTAKDRRRSYRLGSRRRRRGEPGTGTPPAPREPGSKKVRQGTVVSAGGDKTITVEIAVVRRHPTYEKVVRRTSKLHAHDEGNRAQAGDVVRVIEARPLSRSKRWRLLDIVEKAR